MLLIIYRKTTLRDILTISAFRNENIYESYMYICVQRVKSNFYINR